MLVLRATKQYNGETIYGLQRHIRTPGLRGRFSGRHPLATFKPRQLTLEANELLLLLDQVDVQLLLLYGVAMNGLSFSLHMSHFSPAHVCMNLEGLAFVPENTQLVLGFRGVVI